MNGGTTLECEKCNVNYVLRSNKLECVSLTNIPNCKKAANSGNSCLECNTGYGLLSNGGSCVLGNISNCKTYNTSNALGVATCLVCNAGFYLTNNTCLAGSVANCEEFDSGKQYSCKTCKTGYLKISNSQLSGDHNYCYPNDASLNCAAADIISDAKGAKFTCTSCSKLFGVLKERASTEA